MSTLLPRAAQGLRHLFQHASLFLHSIRFRLTLWFVAILGLVVAAFGGFIYSTQAHELHLAALERLALQARQLVTFYRLAGLQFSADGQLLVPQLENNTPLLQTDEILVIASAQGQVIYSAGPIAGTEADHLASYGLKQGQEAGPFTYAIAQASRPDSPFQQEYYFAMAPLSLAPGQPGLLILGSPTDPGGQLQRLLVTLLLGGAATLISAWLGGYWLADRAMRPIRTITRTARTIGDTDLNRRLNLHSRDELGELATTFDQMLARLQAAFDRQRQFTADASHELRTPLTIINLETERVLTSPRSAEEYTGTLKLIRSENEYMARLVNDLLTLARMDAGQTALKLEELDLSEVIVDVIERLAPLAQRQGVSLVCGDLPEMCLRGDRQYLGQMLSNLVENAIKYSGGPGKLVQVAAGFHPVQTAVHARVQVSDGGPGIAAEHLPHLFDRFYRVDQARQRPDDGPAASGNGNEPGGSGLGLSIVQWIAQAHGGQVTVQSEVGRGSVFEIDLPLGEA